MELIFTVVEDTNNRYMTLVSLLVAAVDVKTFNQFPLQLHLSCLLSKMKQSKTKQSKAKQTNANQHKAKQSQSKAKQSKTKQRQNKAKQSKAKQSKAE